MAVCRQKIGQKACDFAPSNFATRIRRRLFRCPSLASNLLRKLSAPDGHLNGRRLGSSQSSTTRNRRGFLANFLTTNGQKLWLIGGLRPRVRRPTAGPCGACAAWHCRGRCLTPSIRCASHTWLTVPALGTASRCCFQALEEGGLRGLFGREAWKRRHLGNPSRLGASRLKAADWRLVWRR